MTAASAGRLQLTFAVQQTLLTITPDVRDSKLAERRLRHPLHRKGTE